MTTSRETADPEARRRPRTWRRKLLTVLLLVGVLGIPAAVGLPGQFEDRDPLEAAIDNLGFFPTRPPTRLRGPGSLFLVGVDGSIKRTVCEADHVLVGSLVQESDTTLTAARYLQKVGYSLDAGIVDRINAQLESKRIATVRYELNNVKVLEISGDRLVGISQRLMRDPNCALAIEQLVKSREFVCQGVSVLLASAKYTVEADSRQTGGGKVSTDDLGVVGEVLRESDVDSTVAVVPDLRTRSTLAAQSSGTHVEQSYMLSTGEGLHYGVKLNELCMTPADAETPWRLPRNAVERVAFKFWQLWPT